MTPSVPKRTFEGNKRQHIRLFFGNHMPVFHNYWPGSEVPPQCGNVQNNFTYECEAIPYKSPNHHNHCRRSDSICAPVKSCACLLFRCKCINIGQLICGMVITPLYDFDTAAFSIFMYILHISSRALQQLFMIDSHCH